MKLRPPVVYHFQSDAEERVFEMLQLSRFDDSAVGLHSLNLPIHQYKQWAEVDFVIVSRRGVLLLEVKGGGVERRDGIWYFTNRFGEHHRRSEGPFDQVRSAMFSLKKTLEDRGDTALAKRFSWGWGVILTDANLPNPGVEIPKETILDKQGLDRAKGAIDPFLSSLTGYWSRREKVPVRASEQDVKEMVARLRPDFEAVPTLSSRLDSVVEQIVRFTEEQLRVLDSSEENPRILCQGPAGTGKTMIAIEIAKRDAAAGVRTGFVCRRPELAAFVARHLKPSGIDVIQGEALSGIPKGGLVERLVVDEAQDFLTDEGLRALDRQVRGGLEGGQWRLFMDPNNQAGLDGEPDYTILSRLRGLSATVKLSRNCRNTKEIVVQTALLTGASLGDAQVDGHGFRVDFAVTSGETQTAGYLAARIKYWLQQDIRPGGITILSPRGWDNSAARLLPPDLVGAIAPVNEMLVSDWPPATLTFSTISGFKGLENRCVAVIDLEEFDGELRSIAELYVAMTRANAMLWMAVPLEKKAVFDALQAKHALMMAAGKAKEHV